MAMPSMGDLSVSLFCVSSGGFLGQESLGGANLVSVSVSSAVFPGQESLGGANLSSVSFPVLFSLAKRALGEPWGSPGGAPFCWV